MSYTFKPGTKVLRKPAVKATTGLSDSSIDRMIKSGDFPKPIQLGARAVGWPDFVVYDWLNERAKTGATS
jgi:prophage regulatory protein